MLALPEAPSRFATSLRVLRIPHVASPREFDYTVEYLRRVGDECRHHGVSQAGAVTLAALLGVVGCVALVIVVF